MSNARTPDFVKPLRLRLHVAINVPGAVFDRTTRSSVRSRLARIDEALTEAEQTARTSYISR